MTRSTVLVTGAAKRLGAEIARAFDAAGWHVIVHYHRSRDAAEALASRLGSAETVACNLADPDAVVATGRAIAARHDNWAALVNSASVFEFDDWPAPDPALFDRAMHTNALGPATLTATYLTYARARTGRRVIDVLDQKLANINPDFFSYTMSKHALAGAGAMLAVARAGSADRIYGLAPGAMLPSHDQVREEHETSGRMNLLERLTTPQELADAAVFLAAGQLASGQVLYVDSGQHLIEQPRDVLFLAREG